MTIRVTRAAACALTLTALAAGSARAANAPTALAAASARAANAPTALAAASARAATSTDGLVWDHRAGGERYVALGDSAAAGPLIPNQRNDPFACLRSDQDFPSVAAAVLGVSALNDATCSGAVIDNIDKTPQTSDAGLPIDPPNPPQLGALSPDTTLVTLGPIGANDFGLTTVGTDCLIPLGSCPGATMPPSSDPNVAAINALAPKLARVLTEIHGRAPLARVFVVGYGYYLSPGGCWPWVPGSPQNSDYVQRLVDLLDGALAQAAAQHGATYVSLQDGDAVNHTMCAPPGQQWLQLLPTTGLGFPAHPTALGMANFGRIVAATVRATSAAGAPKLSVGVSGPRWLVPDHPSWLRVTIRNLGTAVARGLTLRVGLPRGVRADRRSRPLGDIVAGGLLRVRIRLTTISRRQASRVTIMVNGQGLQSRVLG